MNDTKYTSVLVSYSLGNSKQPGFCQNSQVPRPLRITRLSEPFVGFPNNVRRGVTSNGRRRHGTNGAAEAARDELEREERRRASHALTNDAPWKE